MSPTLIILVLLGLSQAIKIRQVDWQYDNGVLILGRHNFDQALLQFPVLLVEFYAPWCPHCQSLQPQFNSAAVQLQTHQITLAKVDCTREHDLQSRFNVPGYPTLRIFNQRLEYHYQGGRTSDTIVQYMLRHVSLHQEGAQNANTPSYIAKDFKKSNKKAQKKNQKKNKIMAQKRLQKRLQ